MWKIKAAHLYGLTSLISLLHTHLFPNMTAFLKHFRYLDYSVSLFFSRPGLSSVHQNPHLFSGCEAMPCHYSKDILPYNGELFTYPLLQLTNQLWRAKTMSYSSFMCPQHPGAWHMLRRQGCKRKNR